MLLADSPLDFPSWDHYEEPPSSTCPKCCCPFDPLDVTLNCLTCDARLHDRCFRANLLECLNCVPDCTYCGQPVEEEDLVRCKNCGDKYAFHSREASARIKKKPCISNNGYCFGCAEASTDEYPDGEHEVLNAGYSTTISSSKTLEPNPTEDPNKLNASSHGLDSSQGQRGMTCFPFPSFSCNKQTSSPLQQPSSTCFPSFRSPSLSHGNSIFH